VGYFGDIRLWDVEGKTLIAENPDFAQTIPFLPWWFWSNRADPTVGGLPTWSFDSTLLAVPDNFHKVDIWNLESGELISTLSDHKG
jgi:WD40 repeat protein